MGMSQALLVPIASVPPRVGRLLHLRADRGITQNGAALFTATDKACLVFSTKPTRLAGVSCTVEAWIKPTAVSGYQGIFEGFASSTSKRGIAVLLNGAYIRMAISDGSTVTNYGSTGTVVAGVWSHIVVVLDRTNGVATFYINGAAAGTADISAYNSANISPIAVDPATIGSTGGNTEFYGGALAGVRYYDGNALTAADVAVLYQNKEPISYANLPADIKAKLGTQGADWPLTDEPGGTYQDLHGSNDLTFSSAELLSNTGFETRTGRTWANFVSADKAGLHNTSCAGLDLGTNDRTYAISFKTGASIADLDTLLTQGAQGDAKDFVWIYLLSNGQLVVQFNDSTAPYLVRPSAVGLITTNTAYTLIVKLDRDGNATYSLNDGATTSLGSIATKTTSCDPGNLKISFYVSGSYHFQGYISQLGIWNRLTTDAEDTEYYNGGLGKYYNEMSAGLKSGCIGFWDLTEASGTREDKVGTNHLTEYLSSELVTNGTFTQANGPPTGWTNVPSYLWDTCSVVSNALSVIKDTTPAYSGVNQQLTLTSGRSYTIGASLTKNSGGRLGVVYEATSWGSAAGLTASLSSTNLSYSATFTATASNGFINFYSFDADTATDWLIDNISLKAASIPAVSDADLVGSWDEFPSGGAVAIDTATYHGGAIAVRITRVTSTPYIASVFTTTLGSTYIGKAWIKAASGTPNCYIGQGGSATSFTVSTTWTEYTETFTAIGANVFLIGPVTDSATVYCDDTSLKASKLQATNGPSGAYASDSSGNGYHATLTGFSTDQLQTAWTPRSDGLALTFDGTDDYCSCGTDNALNLYSAYTISALVYCTSVSVDRIIYDRTSAAIKGVSVMVRVTTRRVSVLHDGSTKVTSSDAIPLNAWTLVTVTKAAGAAAKIYFNGTEVSYVQQDNVDASSASGAVAHIGGNTTIGAWSTYYWSGNLDDVRVYNTALTAAQVTQLYGLPENQEVTGATAVAQWRFNDGPPSQTASDGEPVAAWESIDSNRHVFRQTNILKRPKWIQNGLNGRPVVRFDGVDDYMSTLTAILTGDAGTVVMFGKITATPAAWQYMLSQANTAVTNQYWAAIARGPTGTTPNMAYEVNNNTLSILDAIRGGTAVSTSASCWIWTCTGAASGLVMILNGVTQTLTVIAGADNGNWWADMDGEVVTTLGCLNRVTQTVFTAIDLAELIIYNRVLSASELARELAYSIGEFGVSP
jgi:hypothetical protein